MTFAIDDKALRRRLAVLAVAALFSVLGLLLLGGAQVASERAFDRQVQVHDASAELHWALPLLETACELAVALPDRDDESALRSRIGELAEEVGDAGLELLKALKALRLGTVSRQFEDELDELVGYAAVVETAESLHPGDLARLAQVSGQLREIGRNAVSTASGKTAGDRRRIRLVRDVGLVALLLATVGLVAATVLFGFDVLAHIVGPLDLEGELHRVERLNSFQHRMARLAGIPPQEVGSAPWRLHYVRCLREHPTHSTFEAVAVQEDRQILLWGKAYTWGGWLKGMQRIFWPAYGRATWQALCRMHAHGLNCPFPVHYGRAKRRGLTVGSLVLAEHVGPVQPVKMVVESAMELLDPPQRRALLERIVEFWRRCHECGLSAIQPRYLHCTDLPAHRLHEARFYLFDLDKVRITHTRVSLLRRCSRWRSYRRLLSWLRNYLRPEELELCRTLLTRPADSHDSGHEPQEIS